MLFLLAGLAATTVAAATLATSVEPAANASALHFTLHFDEATGSTSLSCRGSSTGWCTFWIGDPVQGQNTPGQVTIPVGTAPATVTIDARQPAFCAGVDLQMPPNWPACIHGPLGGALDRSASVDYRWK